jgi:hypothetical protein
VITNEFNAAYREFGMPNGMLGPFSPQMQNAILIRVYMRLPLPPGTAIRMLFPL